MYLEIESLGHWHKMEPRNVYLEFQSHQPVLVAAISRKNARVHLAHLPQHPSPQQSHIVDVYAPGGMEDSQTNSQAWFDAGCPVPPPVQATTSMDKQLEDQGNENSFLSHLNDHKLKAVMAMQAFIDLSQSALEELHTANDEHAENVTLKTRVNTQQSKINDFKGSLNPACSVRKRVAPALRCPINVILTRTSGTE
ncbi:hypothetical protein CVT25_000391 [Psilocybe cyanescens]|uniref:Uncharacterized protein n=1 Tax=Psilocybe cyanescens TaxID=93625 RepID=A0A409XYU1_PSICY|nr:hypothetical protein CVT25_000391 [Psilocybe cyanescens]